MPDDARLLSLTLTRVDLDSDSAIETYTAALANIVASGTVVATAFNPKASVAILPTADADSNASEHQVTLSEGENAIMVTPVYDHITKTY